MISVDPTILQQETPFQIASNFETILSSMNYEILIGINHLALTKYEMFQRDAQSIFWTTVEAFRGKFDYDGLQPDQQTQIIGGETFNTFKHSLLQLIFEEENL